MKKETWAPLMYGLYLVSDRGRVKRFDGAPRRPSITKSGYARLILWRNNTGKTHFVHRLVAWAFLGPRLPGLNVNHKNGNKLDNRASNLEYVTPKANSRHAVQLGNFGLGERQGLSKLTAKAVRDIRARYVRGNGESLARRYGVTPANISAIIHRKTWKHI